MIFLSSKILFFVEGDEVQRDVSLLKEKELPMEILLVHRDMYAMNQSPSSQEGVVVGRFRVRWEKFREPDFISHPSAEAAALDILSRKPDVIFMTHDFGDRPNGDTLETGEDIARILRLQGFKGRLIGTGSKHEEQEGYCDEYSGDTARQSFKWLMGFAVPK